MPKYNPFKPGSIIHPGMFHGRIPEIRAIENAFFQTVNGNPTSFLIHGERGIGKSSLLFLLDNVARGTIPTLDGSKLDILTVNVELEPSDTYTELTAKIAREFTRTLDRSEAVRKSLSDLWEFLTRWEVFGVKYNKEELRPEVLVEELAEKMIAVAARLKERGSGIFVFIDEADKAPAHANLGECMKVLTERLAKRGCGNTAFGLVGITEVLGKLRKSHESSVRIFQPFELGPLAPEERRSVFSSALDEAAEKNGFPTAIEADALELLVNVSEGYPHFIQQYGYSAFETDTDNVISRTDVAVGLTKENGALHQLGMRYFENMYTGEIYSDDYRKVLQVIAVNPEQYMSRGEITKRSGLKTGTISNALHTLTKKHILLPMPGKKGMFRLPSRSFAVWIAAYKVIQTVGANQGSDRTGEPPSGSPAGQP